VITVELDETTRAMLSLASVGIRVARSGKQTARIQARTRDGLVSRSITLPCTAADLTAFLDAFEPISETDRANLETVVLESTGTHDAIRISVPDAMLARDDNPHRVRPLSRPVVHLIAGAAERLAPALRERFASDWATDALWVQGRWARLRFALALRLWTVPRLRRDAESAQREGDVPRRA
jgi:hypothetical protein